MEKILVTTDLSVNSVAGLRFAMQLATQRKLELVFFYVNELWDEAGYRNPLHADVLNQEKETVRDELESFVKIIYKSMGVTPGNYKCVLHYHFGVVNSIIDYAVSEKCGYICISTHGTGNVAKLIGTNAGELIKESPVPVLCIPKTYEACPVTRVLYASDMTDYDDEIKKVITFGKPLHADIHLANLSKQAMPAAEVLAVEEETRKKFGYEICFQSEEKDSTINLAENIDKVVEKFSPSLLVMFTQQDRSFFELLFSPSKTERYSFRTKVPLLVYNKDPQ